MVTNTLNTRIINKHDTEINWNKAINFIPKNGELIIYSSDSTFANPRIKIGDGTTIVSNLKFSDSECIKNPSNTITITIATTDWVLDSNGYYTYQYNNSKINLISKAILSSDSSSTNAFILYEIYDGYIIFTSDMAPSASISFNINIIK